MIPPFSIYQVTGPSDEPISTDEGKAAARIPSAVTDFDTEIDTCIQEAREFVEGFTGRRLMNSVWDILFDYCDFEVYASRYGMLELPYSPISAIGSVTYLDTAGASTVWSSANYVTDFKRIVPRLYPIYGGVWPTMQDMPNALTVRVTAGYANAAAVPEIFRGAVRLLTAHRFEVKTPLAFNMLPSKIQFTLESLLNLQRTNWL